MKRQIISFGLMLAAAFTLTNCAKEIANPNEQLESAGVPFEIVATTVDTKTVNDGMSTSWAEGDAINLFHAVASSATYVDNGSFSISAEDLTTGKFKGTLNGSLDTQNQYDWYALYPYSSYIHKPDSQTSGYTYIGGRSDTPQEQSGINNMDHIAGKNYPLYGKVSAVSTNVLPQLEMRHASALLKVYVTNTLETSLIVKNISFTAPEGISLVGTFYLDITGDNVGYKDATYVSNVANLNVSDAEIEAGASAAFYLAVKPFEATAGETLEIAVNGYGKPLVLTSPVTFSAGKIKTLNFSYDKVETPKPEGTQEVSIVSKDLGIDNGVDVTSVNNGLLEFAQGTNENNAPKYYASGYAIRMYPGNTLTVTAPANSVLTTISFKFVSGYGTSLSCTNSNTYSNSTWTGELDKVTFEVSGDTQTRITEIVVTYKEGQVAEAEITGIEVIEPKTEYFVNTDFVAPKVNALYSNGTVKEVEEAVFSGYNLSVLGTHTVKVSYENFETTYNIVVSEPAGNSYSLHSGDLVEGDYVIVYDGGAMKASVSSSRLQYLNVEVVEDVIYEPDASVVWHIAKSGEYWTIYNESVSKYAAGTGAKNKAQLLTSGSDDMSLWTATGTSTYEFVNKANAAKNVNKTLRRNGTYGFACYAESTGGALTLYKKN